MYSRNSMEMMPEYSPVGHNQRRFSFNLITSGRRSVLVTIASIAFGLSSWISISALWLEVPVLINSLPERWALASQLTLAIQSANLIAFLYCILHACSSRWFNETSATTFQMIIGLIASFILIFAWDQTTQIAGTSRSLVLFVCTFALAIIDCLSSITFLPFMARFRHQYLIPYLIGEGLSGVLALLFSIAQNPKLSHLSTNTGIDLKSLRFQPGVFFVSIFITIILSWLGFLYLLLSSRAEKELIYLKKKKNTKTVFKRCMGLEETEWETGLHLKHLDQQQKLICNQQLMLTNEIKRVLDSGQTPRAVKRMMSTSTVSQSDVHKYTKFEYFFLQIVILLACVTTFGLLPPIQPHSCMPLGQQVLNYAVLLTCIAYPLGCVIALRRECRSLIKLGILSLLSIPLIAFVVYVASYSPHAPPFIESNFSLNISNESSNAQWNPNHDASLLNFFDSETPSSETSSTADSIEFLNEDLPILESRQSLTFFDRLIIESKYLWRISSAKGKIKHYCGILMVLSWFFITLILSYVKTMITVLVNEHAGESGLFRVGIYTQIGSLLGAFIMYLAINFLHLFQEQDVSELSN